MSVISHNETKNGPKKAEEKPSLYASHIKVYPQRIAGTFRRIKWLTLYTLLGLYYLVPWIRWDRGPGAPSQAVLIDMPARRAYFFGIEIWPQEVYYLAGILILGAIGLFLATGLAGRVWCGFTCPQTVWTDLFMWVERKIEGSRNKRMKLDAGPLTLEKAAKKISKHAAWIVISIITGGAWIFYYGDAPTMLKEMLTGQASQTVYGFLFLFTATTYLLAGWAREQVCTYMCPWPRFQSAMFDEDTLIVTYEAWRGEPRGKAKTDDKIGDCVDCNLCQNVCPTGVDIRKGSQLECIGCALCIDACNSVMTKLNRPLNLITYDSISNQNARQEGKPERIRLIRPRTVAYMALLTIVGGIMAYGLLERPRVEVNIQRDRSPLFVTLSNGDIRNGYTFKILNMLRRERTFNLTTEYVDNATMTVIGINGRDRKNVTLKVGPDTVGTYRVFVKAPPQSLKAESQNLEFVLRETGAQSHVEVDSTTKFYGPKK
ncbi:cytochrome c oxidase accessory protein CcoG [Varunaivibrio sulfuroxidans]|uniref:Cytochrome c oxidase accessory protein FixG n=1 Tax=Varunaivibrio sulfuroxidans TaxID=1773489 RepID=A0A4R3JFM7_9PROT|nr:cytochrome c oxidase accessory protein CcoG [Varunaivibrio sulfuroxidans]TCS64083.1 cytochrome c oxidase accessory protein FixG [Varunaivibrio sulfuroxidans]WES31467.1 cytochrome c oxidase accessory protein CcoG [Varunaivibrio sulfuroxidans]